MENLEKRLKEKLGNSYLVRVVKGFVNGSISIMVIGSKGCFPPIIFFTIYTVPSILIVDLTLKMHRKDKAWKKIKDEINKENWKEIKDKLLKDWRNNHVYKGNKLHK